MGVNTDKELAALRRMTAAELRAKYEELFGERSRSGNRDWLFRRCAWRVQALAEGGLSEPARQRPKELAREADLRLRPQGVSRQADRMAHPGRRRGRPHRTGPAPRRGAGQ
jgi:hypothetical protein